MILKNSRSLTTIIPYDYSISLQLVIGTDNSTAYDADSKKSINYWKAGTLQLSSWHSRSTAPGVYNFQIHVLTDEV